MDFESIVGHDEIIKHFKASIEMGRVAHAYIICGEKNSGKKSLANAFAKTLQCECMGTEPCNTCQSCLQAETKTHPDIITVTHEKETIIKAEEIREQLVNSIDIKPYKSKYKIYIIEDGELMNTIAQNALLKSIEEPPEYGIVLLLTTSLDKLLPTIRSRCIELNLKPLKDSEITEYLVREKGLSSERAEFCAAYAQGNLGKAILLATNDEYNELVRSVIKLEANIYNMKMDDIASSIEECQKYKLSIGEYLDLMMVWYRDVLMIKATDRIDKIIFREEYVEIKKQANYLSYNDIEKKTEAIENAKLRLAANARLEDVMRLLIMTLKEN